MRLPFALQAALFCLGWLSAAKTTFAQAANPPRDIVSTQARRATLELVRELLDERLAQLADNGLADQPVWNVCAQCRTEVDGLVESEFAPVLHILDAESSRPGRLGADLLGQAREEARKILLRVEQNSVDLARRLKLASWASRGKRLEELLAGVLARVESARGEEDASESEVAPDCLRASELLRAWDQDLLRAVNWGGSLGRTALRVRQNLPTAEVAPWYHAWSDPESPGEARDTRRERPTLASISRQTADALVAVLAARQLVAAATIELASDLEGRLAELADLLARQQSIRGRLRDAHGDQDIAPLVDLQSALHARLKTLVSAEHPTTIEESLRRAERTAAQASENLFAARPSEALDKMDLILTDLRSLESYFREQVELAAVPAPELEPHPDVDQEPRDKPTPPPRRPVAPRRRPRARGILPRGYEQRLRAYFEQSSGASGP